MDCENKNSASLVERLIAVYKLRVCAPVCTFPICTGETEWRKGLRHARKFLLSLVVVYKILSPCRTKRRNRLRAA